VSVSGLTDKQRPSAANGLDAESLEAIRFAVSEKLRREYHQSPAFAVETADEMVDQAYIEYAEKSDAEREEVRSLAGLLITTAVRRSIDRARREGREIYGEGAQAIIDSAQDQAPSTFTASCAPARNVTASSKARSREPHLLTENDLRGWRRIPSSSSSHHRTV
jgi:DNA-directed RNA polymerase specialized sigma24 family protein